MLKASWMSDPSTVMLSPAFSDLRSCMVCTHLATAICCRCKLACRSGTVTHRVERTRQRAAGGGGEQASRESWSESTSVFVSRPPRAPALGWLARLTLLQLFVEQFELCVSLMDGGHGGLDDALEPVHLLADQHLAAERMRPRPRPPLLQRRVHVHDGAGAHEHGRDVERVGRGWGTLLVHRIGGVKLKEESTHTCIEGTSRQQCC